MYPSPLFFLAGTQNARDTHFAAFARHGKQHSVPLLLAGSALCSMRETTAIHRESRISFQNLEKELTDRSVKPSPVWQVLLDSEEAGR